MRRGGPRMSLYDLCKKLQWPMPSFESVERDERADKKSSLDSAALCMLYELERQGKIAIANE
ncbi:hypothetical protein BC332_21162 [Capsicum chinense]|nr:hypothetical protein BC332_21162 [Capsicum chinense]